MIRHELYANGECVEATVIDLDAGTIAAEERGEVTSLRSLTADEWRTYAPPALDAAGALATLLAVEGVVSVDAAAAAVGQAPEALVREAQAWSAAAEL